MLENEKNNNGQISEEALDALLAQWAESEMEPPAQFHADTMKRLRMEQQTGETQKEQNKVITFFTSRKKWMSVAAAAVLVLCCIPVVQAQFGNSSNIPGNDLLPEQVQLASQEQETDAKLEETQSTEERRAEDAQTQERLSGTPKVNAADGQAKSQTAAVNQSEQSLADGAAQQQSTKTQRTEQKVQDESSHQDEQAEAPIPSDSVPFAAAYTGAEEEQPPQQIRGVEAKEDQVQAEIAKYEDAIIALTENIEDLRGQFEDCEAKLKADPTNTALQEALEELQKEMDIHQKEIETLQQTIDALKQTEN